MKRFVPILLMLALAPTVLAQAKARPMADEPTRATGYVAPTKEKRVAAYQRDRVRNGGRVAMAAKMSALPTKFDCTELGWVPPIEDQGNCGSCYGVATADQLTGTFIKAGYQKNDGSFAIRFQYGLDCERFGGCNGGWGWDVAEYMRDRGFPAEHYVGEKGEKITDYPPYEARVRTCRTKAGAKMWKPAEIGFCSGASNRRATVAEIKASLMQYGLVNIAFNANSAYSNAGPNSIVRVTGQANHETTLAGWDDAKNNGKGAWKTRGNWGKSLGDQGYVWMTYDSDLVDPFWMSQAPLPTPPDPEPEPPDPPDPPTPTPPTPGSIDIMIITRASGKVEKYELWPVGTQAAMIKALEAEIKINEAKIEALKKMSEPPAPTPPAPPPSPEPKPEPPSAKPQCWRPDVTYEFGARVTHAGRLWMCGADRATGREPPNIDYWLCLGYL